MNACCQGQHSAICLAICLFSGCTKVNPGVQVLLVAQVGKGFSHRKLLGMIQFLGNQHLYLDKSLLKRISTMSQNLRMACSDMSPLSLGAPPKGSSCSLLLHLFFCKIQPTVQCSSQQSRTEQGHINSF